MEEPKFNGCDWETAFADAPRQGAGDAAGEFGDAGDRRDHDEPGFRDWDRFYVYCDRVIVGALERQPIQLADREDCRQEIWAELLASRMSRFRGGSLAAWLTTLARNKAVDTIRRASRHPLGSTTEALELAVPVIPAPRRPDEPAALVWLALAELEPLIEQRSYAVFFLRWFERKSFGTIAAALSLTPEQARARHHRTKAKFRQIVERQALRGDAGG